MELDEDNKPDAMEQDADNKPDSSSAMEQDADNKPAAVEKNSKVGMDVDAVDKGKKKMKKQWKTLKFDEYIYEVLKQVHPDIAISGEALDMMDNIINRMLSKISEESKKSTNLRGRTLTIHERDIIALSQTYGRSCYRNGLQFFTLLLCRPNVQENR
uniref:Histone H2B.11-like n=1 Tax=Cicer arietinum TaxID=3827 RepID=A0A1S2Y501_CICAR|nr:histone H2B.11-like [Cicer arietinum]